MTTLTRQHLIGPLAACRGDAAVVTGPGATSGSLWAAGHQPPTLYNMEMGYAVPVSMGIALACPRRQVVALEGEGSMIAGMPALATVGRYRPPNLTIIVFDNGVYGTGGGTVETCAATGTSIAAVARACGIPAEHVAEPTTPTEASEAVQQALGSEGPWVIVARISTDDVHSRGRVTPQIGHVEAVVEARRALARGAS